MTRSMAILFALLALGLAACGQGNSLPTVTKEPTTPGVQTEERLTPSPSSPDLRSIAPGPGSRLDLGDGVVVALVESSSSEFEGKVAYVTHVATGSQLVLDRDGQVLGRHDGRDDGPARLDGVLADENTMERIIRRLQEDEDVRSASHVFEWFHSIRFGDITFLAHWMRAGPTYSEEELALTESDLAPEVYRVAFKADGYAGSDYRLEDGDATYLNPGTPVYPVRGYAPEFRLATLQEGRVTLFESDTNPLAEVGEDLLDIRGKVQAIDILSPRGAKVLGTIIEEQDVERLVDNVLGSPVDQADRDREGPLFPLRFRLADGTSTSRVFWLNSGELSRGIMTDPVVTLLVWRVLPEDQWPDATKKGTKISEGLAAQLGLAYLGGGAPELQVTGKLHSPAVRLMRRSEFDSLTGSASAKPSDPWVWVVEAQGSWRPGGIVSKGKEQDFFFGVVAFDADTGVRYGASYRYASLLQGPTRSPLAPTSTPEPRSLSSGTQSTNRQWGGGTGIQLSTPSAVVQQSGDGKRIQLPQAIEQALAAQPSPDWTLVEAPGLADQPGFSLRLPTGWELRETRPLDSYVGELVGHGVELRFDYGRFSAMLNPDSRPETIYVLVYEDIGGYEAKLVIPLDPSGGLTGVHFRAIDGLRLTIVGKDLTPEQQRTAFAIFRSIRSANRAADEPSASKSNPRLVIRRGPMSVIHEGIDYEAVAGPIREELLDVESLEPTQLALSGTGLAERSTGRRVYLLPGVPLEQGFLVRSAEKGMYKEIWYLDPDTAYPVCQPGSRNYFYVAEGASPTPASVPGADIPTTELSSEGLLEAGWPLVNMASLQIESRGVKYNYVDHSQFGGYVQIEELETLAIDYHVDIGRLPSPALEEIATGATVQDRIRIYRLPNRPVNEVILVDQCPGDLHGHQFVYYQQTGLHRKHTSEAPKLVTTPTPEPMQPGTKRTMPPEYVRLDLDPKVVVAFVDDDDLGRIVYVTHVPSGTQVVLDAESNVLEKHSGSSAGDRALEIALKDVHVMERIQRGLLSEEILPGNGFMDWINFIRFGGISYSSKARRGGGDQVEESQLGEVLYRVAFHVDANLVPGSYRPRDGDAAFLPPGTPIHSVDGYPPSERLAAVVDGEVWLFGRSSPAPSTPTPVVVPRNP